jgi:transposase
MLTAEDRMEISVLSRHGDSIRAIAQRSGRSRNTVRRYLRGSTGCDPGRRLVPRDLRARLCGAVRRG